MGTHATSYEDPFKSGKALGLNHIKLGMWLFLASEVMFFGGLLSAFLHYRVSAPAPVEDALLNITLVGINTFVLLTSSFTVVLGFGSIQTGNVKRLGVFLGATIVLGVLFLSGQVYEFYSLTQEGLTLTGSVFGSSFYTLTGFHGLHVFVGILWAIYVLIGALRGKYSSENNIGVEAFGLYWHFVDIVWIGLFTLIYLI